MSLRRSPRSSPEEAFRVAAVAVDVGGVEQRDARVERAMHDALRRLEVDAAAEVVAAEADQRDAQARAADVAQFHYVSLRSRARPASRSARSD